MTPASEKSALLGVFLLAESVLDFADADLGKFYFIKPAFFHPPFSCG